MILFFCDSITIKFKFQKLSSLQNLHCKKDNEKFKMSLIEQPQDHKDFIFKNLRLGDLMNLSLVCKDLHQDEIRRKWTIQRVVDG